MTEIKTYMTLETIMGYFDPFCGPCHCLECCEPFASKMWRWENM